MTGTRAVLQLNGVSAGYGDIRILQSISLNIGSGETVAIVGPNGSGKSTLAKAIAGLIPVRGGEIRIEEQTVSSLPPWERLKFGFAYVPQEANVFPNMSVSENLRIARECAQARPSKSKDSSDMARELFPEIAGKFRLRAGSLSGGERQLLAFSCALMGNPRLLLLDEPSAGLSPKLTEVIMEKIAAIQKFGVSILLIEQNVRAALRIATRVVVLVGGSVRADAPSADFERKYDLNALFLG